MLHCANRLNCDELRKDGLGKIGVSESCAAWPNIQPFTYFLFGLKA